MKKELVLVALGAAVSLVSCSSEFDIPGKTEPGVQSSPVKFSSSINGATPQTRAGNNTWEAGNTIGIFMVNGTPEIVDNTANRAYKTLDGSKNFSPVSPSDNIYYPVDGSTVNFISYYPWQAGKSLDNLYPVDVTDQNNPVDIDLLYAKTATGYSKAASGNTVQLQFDHKLTHMVLNITPDAGLTEADLEDMVVTVKGLNTATTLNLKDGTLGTPDAVADIVMKTQKNGLKSDAILVPQSIVANAVSIEFRIDTDNGTEVFKWNVPATTFESKKEYVYTVTITRTGIDVTGEINEWEAGTGGSGTAD
ncbi:MAG: fimbrillin family protein [Tannerella sp.]|jgi:archaellin|nr:fimbrillin family protein [Tannerella sp.]